MSGELVSPSESASSPEENDNEEGAAVDRLTLTHSDRLVSLRTLL